MLNMSVSEIEKVESIGTVDELTRVRFIPMKDKPSSLSIHDKASIKHKV